MSTNKLQDYDWLFNQYEVNKLSMQEIGDSINESRPAVKKALCNHGIKIKTTAESCKDRREYSVRLDDFEWINTQYNILCRTTRDIANELGCSKTAITTALRNHNIPIRTGPESNRANNKFALQLNNKEWLYNAYVVEQKSIKRLSTLFSIDEKTIKIRLNLFSIPIRTHHEAVWLNKEQALSYLENRDWLFDQHVTKKISCKAIGEEIGIDGTVVIRYLEKHGIEKNFIYNTSSQERKIIDLLKENNIEFTERDRQIIKPKELDIVIEEKKIAIEINGIHYHSEEFGSKDNKYHESKRLACEQAGYRLITLYEDDINFKFPIIKRFLLNALGLSPDKKVMARKCQVIDISSDDACNFINTYHIQGSAPSNKRIALIYEGEVVAVMLFFKNVLVRYATACKVQGGFGKLLKNCGIEGDIISFVDLDMHHGKTYSEVGFEIDGYIKPDYKYVYQNKRVHKFSFRLKRFRNDPDLAYQEGMTESQLAKLNDIPRIWDSGKLRLKVCSGILV